MDFGNIGDPGLNPNNPFLPDILGAAPVAAAQPAAMTRLIKLPEFWPHAPQIWFARAELQFEVHNILDERQRFAHAANALSYDTVRLVADLITAPPLISPYSILKERLLLSTQLTAVQQADKVLDFPALGDRRPSQLLAEMFEYCPRGEETTAFFRASFLRRLPADVRVMLNGLDAVPLKDLAVRADQLWLTRPAGSSSVAAAVTVEESYGGVGGGGGLSEEPLAAISRGGFRGSWRGRGGRGGGKQASGGKQPGGGSGGAHGGGGSGSAKSLKGTHQIAICWRHRKYGEQAFDCADPSACQYTALGN